MPEMTASWSPVSIISSRRKHADLPAIHAGIQDALNRSGYGELRRVDLDCEGDAVTISGHVPTFYLKQLAQSIAPAPLARIARYAFARARAFAILPTIPFQLLDASVAPRRNGTPRARLAIVLGVLANLGRRQRVALVHSRPDAARRRLAA